ncbi:hypothetical protein SOVF_165900 isoform B [Spinacia oleracea]|nr:hypothetical protein SOVF_165900 isoform B [Spinacia oleracea]
MQRLVGRRGGVNYYNKRGKTTCKCIPCMELDMFRRYRLERVLKQDATCDETHLRTHATHFNRIIQLCTLQ